MSDLHDTRYLREVRRDARREFRKKKTVDTELILHDGDTLSGQVYLNIGERVQDLLNSKQGFFPLRVESGEILLINVEPQQKLHQSGKQNSGKAFMPYRIEKRLISDRQRQCNCIARNPLQKNLVAAGYEPVTGEQRSCLLVWDINH